MNTKLIRNELILLKFCFNFLNGSCAVPVGYEITANFMNARGFVKIISQSFATWLVYANKTLIIPYLNRLPKQHLFLQRLQFSSNLFTRWNITPRCRLIIGGAINKIVNQCAK